MDAFCKEDLVYEYSWSKYDPKDPKVSGVPDTTEFNKNEGEQVAYLINYLTEHLAWSVEEFGAKVEKLIHERLPEKKISQTETIHWIKENWKTLALKNT
ncbi:MAG: hypothetical protein PHI97_20690 [Desulfobulbus sp.]|nr:hypothetical protein [Desulfobulbus sp.]